MSCAFLHFAASNLDTAMEVEKYQFQLEKVIEALEKDKENLSLLKLKAELEQLISLETQKLDTKEQVARILPKTIVLEKRRWDVGETCMCRWDDGLAYEAVVLAIDGDNYEVAFTGYEQVATVSAEKLSECRVVGQVASVAIGEIQDVTTKKRHRQKKVKNISSKERAVNDKQAAWLTFSAKAGINKSSPKPKAVKGSASAAKRTKHIFRNSDLDLHRDD